MISVKCIGGPADGLTVSSREDGIFYSHHASNGLGQHIEHVYMLSFSVEPKRFWHMGPLNTGLMTDK